MRNILYCSIFLVISQFSSISDGVKYTLDRQRFVDLLATIKPWPSAMDMKDYRTQDWERLVSAARIVQISTPSSVKNVLEDWQRHYIGSTNCGEDGKVYLLMRVTFALPEHAPAVEQFGFGAWIQRLFPDESPNNSDGTINLAWPISWNNGRPRLVSGFQGYQGPPYEAAAEFDYLLKHYKLRDLSEYRSK